MTTCPVCSKPVDPLRARSVGVRDGKVVAYCSAECAAKADVSRPVAVPAVSAAPAKAEPVVAKPVALEAKPEPAKPAPAKTDKPAKAEPPAKAEQPAKPAPVAEPAKKASSTPAPTKRITPPTGSPVTPKRAPEPAAAPVGAKPVDEPTRQRDSYDAKRAEEWLDEEPAEEPASHGRRARWPLAVGALLVLGGVGFAGYTFWYKPRQQAAVTSGPGGAPRPGSNLPAIGPTPAPGQGAVDAAAQVAERGPTKEQALDTALTVLREQLVSKTSPRIQRGAAMALARTRDAAALERLATALTQDQLERAGVIEVAYALGRAGDKRGIDALAKLLTVPERSDRLEAARALARLGDKRAIEPLASFLQLDQHKLGAAGALAPLAEPRALKVLAQVHGDVNASKDDRLMATIALGRAGNREVAEELRGLLSNPSFNAFAADALAALRDEAARPVLEKQLEVSVLRVRSARALRRLDPDRDPEPYLARLVAMLRDPALARDVEQRDTAEAILLLAGPASWAELP